MTRDVGAQPERTRLSWRRTVLAATVVILLALRHAITPPITTGDVVVAGLLGLAWVGMLVGAQRRIRGLAAARPAAMRAPWPLMATLAVITIACLALLNL